MSNERRMSWWGSALATIAVIGLAQVAMASAASASLAPIEPSNTKDASCSVVVGKIDPATGDSPVRSWWCSDGTSSGSNARVAEADLTTLATYWQDANYEGFSVTIYGDQGTCDADGYGSGRRILDDITLIFQVSSFQMYGNCRTSGWWDSSWQPYAGNYSGKRIGQFYPVVPTDWNDRITSTKMWSV